MKGFTKIMDVVAKLEEIILVVTGLGTTFITFLAVVARKTEWFSFTWSEEIVINVFIYMIMAGCALQVRSGNMISLSLVYDSVHVKGKKIIATLATIVSIAFYAIVTWTGFEKVSTMMASNKRTSILLWPEWVFMIALPIGAILLALHTVEWLQSVYQLKEEPGEGTGKNEEVAPQ